MERTRLRGAPGLLAILGAAAVAASMSCNNVNGPSDQFGCGISRSGTVSATIDGVAWNAGCVSVAAVLLGDALASNLAIVASDTPPSSGHSVGVTLVIVGMRHVPLATGVYPLGGAQDPSGATMVSTCVSGSTAACDSWTAEANKGSGTIVVQDLTAHTASGTFVLSLSDQPSSGRRRVVADGLFNVMF